ncbi:uncharacterized protein BJX67DRAFT_368368 [Aspergillus lucknowensis]|uniref:Uncharacterized protein n=1 Tax=Aspergillus lucknowensis TaxID=176173 RepID=A0ABR4L6J0_9EURO
MTDSLFIYDASQAEEPWDDDSRYAPTPGDFGRSTGYSLSPSPHRTLPQPPQDRLGFLPLAEWERGGEYDQQPPRYVCYTVKWKLLLNNKPVGNVTEKDLVVAPSQYWEKYLQVELDNMVKTKRKPNQRVRPESTTVKVEVNDRKQCPLEQFDNGTKIKWTPVEKQLCKWSNMLRIAKKLTVSIAFSYRQDDNGSGPTKKGDKRGRVSATNMMLAERDAYIAEEEERTGRPSAWNSVYELMQCNVRSCQLNSDWCWEDPKDSKHYKLREPHIDRLVDYVEKGGKLESHNDVPRDIRRDLILESQTGRKSKKDNSLASGSSYHPVSINVLPAQESRASIISASPPRSLSPRVVIQGDQVAAVKNYCKWLESRYRDEAYKADFRKARDVVLRRRMDLELILDNPNPGFFTDEGIEIGTALRFIRDIQEWDRYVKSKSPPQGTIEGHSDDDLL